MVEVDETFRLQNTSVNEKRMHIFVDELTELKSTSSKFEDARLDDSKARRLTACETL